MEKATAGRNCRCEFIHIDPSKGYLLGKFPALRDSHGFLTDLSPTSDEGKDSDYGIPHMHHVARIVESVRRETSASQ